MFLISMSIFLLTFNFRWGVSMRFVAFGSEGEWIAPRKELLLVSKASPMALVSDMMLKSQLHVQNSKQFLEKI